MRWVLLKFEAKNRRIEKLSGIQVTLTSGSITAAQLNEVSGVEQKSQKLW